MSTLRKRGGKYSARFVSTTDGNRKEKTIALGTSSKETAKKLQIRLEAGHELGHFDVFGDFDYSSWKNADPNSSGSSSNPLLYDVIKEFLDARIDLKKKTHSNYKTLLEKFNRVVGDTLFFKFVEQSDIREFVYNDDLTIASQNNYLRHLKVFFSWAEENGYGENQCKKLKKKMEVDSIRKQIISEAELQTLCAAHSKYIQLQISKGYIKSDGKKQLWFIPLVKFTFYTGLRLSEVLNLKWKSIDFANSKFSFEGKRGKTRTMILMDAIKEDLLKWKASVNCDGNRYVFESPKSRPDQSIKMTKSVSKEFKKNVKRAGLDDYIHFHSLRHSCATNLIKLGFNIYYVKQMMGHSSITTTTVYLHIVSTDIIDVARELGVSS